MRLPFEVLEAIVFSSELQPSEVPGLAERYGLMAGLCCTSRVREEARSLNRTLAALTLMSKSVGHPGHLRPIGIAAPSADHLCYVFAQFHLRLMRRLYYRPLFPTVSSLVRFVQLLATCATSALGVPFGDLVHDLQIRPAILEEMVKLHPESAQHLITTLERLPALTDLNIDLGVHSFAFTRDPLIATVERAMHSELEGVTLFGTFDTANRDSLLETFGLSRECTVRGDKLLSFFWSLCPRVQQLTKAAFAFHVSSPPGCGCH